MVDQNTELKTLTVVELKQELTQRQLALDGKKADLIARLAPVLETEAAERERQRQEEEEKARLEEEERQRQLQLEQERQEEEEHTGNEEVAADGDQLGENGEEFDSGPQYTDEGGTEAGTGPPPSEDTPVKSEARTSSVTADQDEWQTMDVPKDWHPCPLLRARNVSMHQAVSEADVLDIIEEAGYEVRSVHFETAGTSRVAYIRLEPDCSNKQGDNGKQENGSQGGSSDTMLAAEEAAKKLQAQSPAPALKGETLIFDAPSGVNVEMFVANLRPEWEELSAFKSAMEAEGDVIRCFIMRNARGASKGYGFVEFATTVGANRAKSVMDRIENEMRPDFRSRNSQDGRRGPGDRWQQIKLQRAEWTRPRSLQALFGRVLYVSNLPQGYDDVSLLRDVFEKYGRCSEVHLPRNKQTGNPKGFGFIEFHTSRHADGAYRGLQHSDHPRLGKFLVSFANPAKPLEASSGQQGGHNRQQGGMRMAQGHRGHGGGNFSGNRGHGGGNRGVQPPRSMGWPMQRGPSGDRGRMGPMPPPLEDNLSLRVQQQQQHAIQQAQMQMTLQMQAQMRQQQAQMQQQVRAAQMQAQAATAAAQQVTQQAQAVQRKAAAEAEARRKAEEDRKTALRAQQLKAQAAQQLGSYAQQYPSSSQGGSYYGSYSQGQGSGRASAQGAGGYGEGGYNAGAGASGGYGAGASGAAEGGTSHSQGYGTGYGSMSGAGASSTYGDTAYGSGSGYNSYQQGYGGSGGGGASQYESGYGGKSSGYDAGSYEQGGYGSHSGHKRDAGGSGSGNYSQYSQGYGSGSYGSYGQQDNKRQRY